MKLKDEVKVSGSLLSAEYGYGVVEEINAVYVTINFSGHIGVYNRLINKFEVKR